MSLFCLGCVSKLMMKWFCFFFRRPHNFTVSVFRKVLLSSFLWLVFFDWSVGCWIYGVVFFWKLPGVFVVFVCCTCCHDSSVKNSAEVCSLMKPQYQPHQLSAHRNQLFGLQCNHAKWRKKTGNIKLFILELFLVEVADKELIKCSVNRTLSLNVSVSVRPFVQQCLY